MTEVTEVVITVDEQSGPTIVEVGGVNVLVPDSIEMLVDPGTLAPEIVTIETGLVGPQGPVGPPGILRINHGSDASTPRPTLTEAPIVLWVGSVTPDEHEPTVDLIAWTP